MRRAPEGVEVAALERLDADLAALPADASAEDIQNIVYEIGKTGGFAELRDWFKALYETCSDRARGRAWAASSRCTASTIRAS